MFSECITVQPGVCCSKTITLATVCMDIDKSRASTFSDPDALRHKYLLVASFILY